MAKLSLRHIYKVYDGKVKAVSDFNLEIADKEFIVFVGPSGCGKSTTLRMVAGLEEITAGELWIGDKLFNQIEPKNRNISMVFQNYALFPNMTVYDNISFGLRMHKVPKDEIDRKVREAAATLGISEYLDRKPKALSGGQRQRVALGRAIVREPNVFLFDEPLSNLDAKLRARMRTEITKLHKRLQTTFIYVTHDQVEAMTMGDRIVVMKDGFVQQTDTPQNLYMYPENKFVAGFIGTPQMNFFEVTLTRGEGASVVVNHKHFKLRIPAEHTYHIDERYIDGVKPVIMGVRPEDMKSCANAGASSVTATVALVEQLGSQTLIYANTDPDELLTESSKTAFCVSDVGNADVEINSQVAFTVDTAKIHLFDAETERTIKTRVPTVNLSAKVKKGKLHILSADMQLPKALDCLTDGEYSVGIPAESVYFDDNGRDGIVEEAETVYGSRVYRISCGNSRVFCLSNEARSVGDAVKISIALHKATFTDIDGSVAAEPVQTELKLSGGYVRRKVEKELKHFIVCCGVEAETPYEFNRKMYDRGRSILKKRLSFVTDSSAIHLDGDIPATVERVLDYGSHTFAQLRLSNGVTFCVEAKDLPDEVHIGLDFDKLAVYDTDLDIRLF